MSSEVEELLSEVGDPGRSQVLVWLLLVFNLVHSNIFQHFSILIAYVPPHHCRAPEDFNATFAHGNYSFPIDDECSLYINQLNHSEGTTACTNGWEYDTIAGEIYPANEFDLVCDRGYLLDLQLSTTFSGVMLGGLMFGTISDRIGRKRTMSFILMGMSACSIAICFVPDFFSFGCIRFILGILAQGLQASVVSYNSELFRRRMRTIASCITGFVAAIMLPLQGSLFFYLGNWRTVHFIAGILSCISAVYSWFLPESVIWLLSKHRVDQAYLILKWFARLNGLPVDEDLKEKIQKVFVNNFLVNSTIQTRWTDLFRTYFIRKIMLSLIIICFINSCSATGLAFSISTLPGNLYINYVINGAIQLTMQTCALFLFVKVGRVRILSKLTFGSGLVGIVGFFLKYYAEEKDIPICRTISTILALIARNFIAITVSMMFMFSTELLPTILRSTGLGVLYTASRSGGVASPQMLYFLSQIWSVLPQIIFGCLTIVSGFIILSLPETFNRSLPTTIEDVENMTNKQQYPSTSAGNETILLFADQKFPDGCDKKFDHHSKTTILQTAQSIVNVLKTAPSLASVMTTTMEDYEPKKYSR